MKSMSSIRKRDALVYHENGRPGKIEVVPTKPTSTQRDLSLAYSPGVAEPCLAIAKNPDDIYRYTSKGNLVAVISNGTAVLGLGDIGPEASKPVMEGKAVLFKIFADIDVFDIEVDAKSVDEFVNTVKAISPTFGGINLEDISSPDAFEIEERLRDELDIPVMHDDQHGTAIISAAALLNALEIAEKNIEDVKIVVSGAGAAAISCIKLFVKLGAKQSNFVVFDRSGVIHKSRKNLDARKAELVSDVDYKSMEEALKGADMFLGLSTGNILPAKAIKGMAENPIVFALANPEPEISYEKATSARKDVIVATGRSDHPNQVNNVLGFPYIFRGALDVRAKCINDEMKLAAVYALANLAKEPVPDVVNQAYDMPNISFGRELIIPKPLDPRLILHVSVAVAKAAISSGVARIEIEDWDAYQISLLGRLGNDSKLSRSIAERAHQSPKKVVFAEADHYKILKAAEAAMDEGIAFPILLGNRERISKMIEENNIELPDVEIIDPKEKDQEAKRVAFGNTLFQKRNRKGMTLFEATKAMRDRNHFGAMLVESGYADALISGISRNYRNAIRPALQIIGLESGASLVAGMYVMQTKRGAFFFADTTVNVNPTAEELVEITLLVAKTIRKLLVTPKIALLSYSNFGSALGDEPLKVKRAVEILHTDHPELVVDGEIQANFALNADMREEIFPFSALRNKQVNTLIFPNLSSGNIAYKLMQEMGDVEAMGPILLGMKKSFHVLQMGCSVREIVNMVRVAVVDAQAKEV
jgi:malate dehydrogenase (oxaloacetate-decarboxylating)(NADP+)